MNIHLPHYLFVSGILFIIGLCGIFLNKKNMIMILLSIELMLLAVILNFVAFAHAHGDLSGQVFTFFILTVAAAESAIGLSLLIIFFRKKSHISIDSANSMKG